MTCDSVAATAATGEEDNDNFDAVVTPVPLKTTQEFCLRA